MSVKTVDVSVSGITPDAIIGGSVNVSDGDISRQLTLNCMGDIGTVTPNTEVVVTYDAGTSTVIFTGPIVRVARSATQFTVEANDRAHYGLSPYRVMAPFTIATTTSLGAAVNRIALEMGLTTTASDSSRTMQQPLSVERGAEPWRVIKDLCLAAGREVFFSRTGALVVQRRKDAAAAVNWTVGATELLSDPKVTWDTAGYRTACEVIGNEPCGDVIYSLAGGDDAYGRYAVEQLETEDVADQTDADDLASDTLASFDLTDVDAAFTAIPKPTLQVGDKVSAGGVSFRVTQFTLPLGPGSMSVGGHTRVSSKRWRG